MFVFFVQLKTELKSAWFHLNFFQFENMFDEIKFDSAPGETQKTNKKSIHKDIKSDFKNLRDTIIENTEEERLNYVIVICPFFVCKILPIYF